MTVYLHLCVCVAGLDLVPSSVRAWFVCTASSDSLPMFLLSSLPGCLSTVCVVLSYCLPAFRHAMKQTGTMPSIAEPECILGVCVKIVCIKMAWFSVLTCADIGQDQSPQPPKKKISSF